MSDRNQIFMRESQGRSPDHRCSVEATSCCVPSRRKRKDHRCQGAQKSDGERDGWEEDHVCCDQWFEEAERNAVGNVCGACGPLCICVCHCVSVSQRRCGNLFCIDLVCLGLFVYPGVSVNLLC